MRLRTVGLKLSLALIALVAGALGIVYFAVVPTLEDRLVESRTRQLHRTADIIVSDIIRAGDAADFDFRAIVQTESQLRGVRVVVYEYLDESPVFLRVRADSRELGEAVERDRIAQRAAERRRTESGVVERGGVEFAEVAAPFGGAFVLLVSDPLDDALDNVALVQRRLVAAGLIALLAAALVGFGLARVFARRIHRLERAAERIAGGRFDEPVVDPSADELGELARAFDRMRSRLSALERARREFIANASHELRTPIFALGGHVELLADEDMDEETRRDFLSEMRIQVERLTKLATDLLDLSRLDAGRLRVELAPVDLGEVAASVVGEFAVGRGRDHVLAVDTADEALALADEERVRQIARILVDNAIVHTPAGTEVRVSASTRGGVAALRVEDRGAGVEPDEHEQIFERFYRAGGGVTAGSGLGLAIARELATVMGGEVELASRPGLTVFTLKLPATRAEAQEREPALTA